jgi:hypothetical protein
VVAVVVTVLVALLFIRGNGDSNLPDETIGDTDTTVPTVENPRGERTTTTAEGAGTTTPTTTATTLPPGSNLLTGDSSAVLGALAGASDGPDQAYEVVLYPENYAYARLQVPGEPTHVDEYMWRDGGVTGPEIYDPFHDGEELQASYFGLDEIDPAVIPTVAGQTPDRCGPGLNLELSHIIISRNVDFDDQQRVMIRVYAGNERGEGGYVSYLLDGTFVEELCDP